MAHQCWIGRVFSFDSGLPGPQGQGGTEREVAHADRSAAEVLGRSIPLRQTDRLRREHPGLLQFTPIPARVMDMRAEVDWVAGLEFVLG